MSKLKAEAIIKKLMLIFLVLTVSAAGFSGFFVKWALCDGDPDWGFEVIMDGTAKRPFIHRQLLPVIVKTGAELIPEKSKEKLAKKLIERKDIERRYAKADIPPKYVIEYYLMFIICFLLFFATIWILRSLLTEIFKDKVAGTVTALLFALLFPHFEIAGGYYYDFGEIFFLFLAARLALHGNFIALLILTPFAEWNKESFFFYLATLFPLWRKNFDAKKSGAITGCSIFVAGLAYLYVRQMFIDNRGDPADFQLFAHLYGFFEISSYFKTDPIYGIPLFSRMFVLHIIYVLFIIKTSWHNLSDEWKAHAKFAAVINGILYFLFILPGELRDLSMLYTSFLILTGYFLRDIFLRQYQKGEN